MTGRGPVCIRCDSTHGLRFYTGHVHYSKTSEFWLCFACAVELDRFLAGDRIPGTGGKHDVKRGFEIERGSDVGKEDTPSPEA